MLAWAALIILVCASRLPFGTWGGARRALPADAPPGAPSAGRAARHVEALAGAEGVGVGRRHLGTEALHRAHAYVEAEARALVARAPPHLVAEVSTGDFSGVVNGVVLNRRLANAYTNVSVVVLRLAPRGNPDGRAVVLNAHTDSTLGTAGASDCAACVAALLEAARCVVDGGVASAPSSPLLFVFNGGEETFSQGAHGWLQHEWAQQGAALINLESTGPSAPVTLFQTRGRWPVEAFARAAERRSEALRPTGTAAGADLFMSGALPVDSDFSVLHSAWGAGEARLPGVNLASILDGYAYHTDRDTPRRLPRAALQLFVDSAHELGLEFSRALAAGAGVGESAAEVDAQKVVFADFLGLRMMVLGDPTLMMTLAYAPFLCAALTADAGLPRAALAALAALLGAAAAPACLAAARAALLGTPMAFYPRPLLWAALAWAPAALGAMLRAFEGVAPRDGLRGVAAVLAALSAAIALVGGQSSYVAAVPSLAAQAAALLCAPKSRTAPLEARHVIGALFALMSAPTLVNGATFLVTVQFMGEKLGMAGSPPPVVPAWLSLPDVGHAAVSGLAVALTFLCAAPVAAAALISPRSAARALACFAVFTAAALTLHTGGKPYDADLAPKRLILAHVHGLGGVDHAPVFAMAGLDSSPLAAVLAETDANSPLLAPASAPFNSPLKGKEWLSIYPVNDLLFDTLVFPNAPPHAAAQSVAFRVVSVSNTTTPGRSRFELEHTAHVPLFMGVLVQGPLAAWSLGDELHPEKDGLDTWSGKMPYFAARHCGGKGRGGETFRFWVEREAGHGSEPLRIVAAGASAAPGEENPVLEAAVAGLPAWTAAVPITVYHHELLL